MTTMYLESDHEAADVYPLIESAIKREIADIELAIKLTQKRLAPFEQAYHVSSEYFLAEMAAEDLTGGDDEYIQWAGEYHLMQGLKEHLQLLRGIRYRDTNIL